MLELKETHQWKFVWSLSAERGSSRTDGSDRKVDMIRGNAFPLHGNSFDSLSSVHVHAHRHAVVSDRLARCMQQTGK